MQNIIISNPEKFAELKKIFVAQGAQKLHILTDFDRTLTRAVMNGKSSQSPVALIRDGNYLTPDYAPKAHALFDLYHPIEIDSDVTLEEKNKKMHEWWQKHVDLLIASGLTMGVMREIVSQGAIRFRENTMEFIDCLHEKNIPLVIMSAGLGDMIEECLRQAGRLYENVHVIANLFEFDAKGNAIQVKEPIIHSLNKHETAIQAFPFFEAVQERRNVLLLGDGLGDLGMVEGFPYDNLMRIGFLNENVEGNLEKFQKNFDVIICNDGPMDFVLDLCREIV